MNLADLHRADDQALEWVRILGRDEAVRKAEGNAAYYRTYGGADLANSQEFWSEVASAARKMY